MIFEVFIPLLPPGINTQYKRNRNGMVFVNKLHRIWAEKAALIIGARAAELGWEAQPDEEYYVEIALYNFTLDVDAPLKLILDTVSRKLDFDDSKVRAVWIGKSSGDEDGCKISVVSMDALKG